MIDVVEIVAHEPCKAVLEHTQIDENALKPDQVLVKMEYSAISAGTECAWISGNSNNSGQCFPFRPGYSATARIVKVGSEVKNFAVGDRVIAPWAGHRSYAILGTERIWGAVHKIEDDSISMKDASIAHIATFPMLGIRKLQVQMGESVMIAGLGILGQIAIQAARLSGAVPVLGCDYSEERRALAMKLGADMVFDPSEEDFKEKIYKATDGAGVGKTVEVTGKAAALKQALGYTRRMGKIALLGCTRVADCPIDFYRDVHLTGITLIGAHTQNRPIRESRQDGWTDHDDYDTILKYLATGRFNFKDLISTIVTPEECTETYNMLLNSKKQPLGILFDWTNIG